MSQGQTPAGMKEWPGIERMPALCRTIRFLKSLRRVNFVNRKILIDVIGVLLIGLVVVIGYKLSPMLLPKADITVQPDPTCDLQRQACAVRLPGGGSVELAMGTHPIPLVKPFEVLVATTGVSPSRVEIDFAGVEMGMGYNRPVLAAKGEGRFMTEAVLPVCVTGQMVWQATLLLETGHERIAIPFRFTSGSN